MDKKHYVLYLNPCRPDFAQTMTAEERMMMQMHIGYWKHHLDKGTVLVFGPVLDPAAVYGLGIVAVDTEEQLQALIANDPAAAINRYEYHPMLAVVG